MRIDIREFEDAKYLLLIAENEGESSIIDQLSEPAGRVPVNVVGEIDVSDGYGEHYIRLRAE